MPNKFTMLIIFWVISMVVVAAKVTGIVEKSYQNKELKTTNTIMEKRNEIRNHRTNSTDKFLDELWNSDDSW